MRGGEQPLELWSIHLKFFREIILFKSKVWWERGENIIGGKNFDGCFPLLGIPFSNLLLLLMLTKQSLYSFLSSFWWIFHFQRAFYYHSITIPHVPHVLYSTSILLSFRLYSVAILFCFLFVALGLGSGDRQDGFWIQK